MAQSFLSTLTGSFSKPAAENPTVAMMEAAYAHHGLVARYLNCEVDAEHLADAVRGAVAMGWVGFNISLPHKQTVIPLLDELSPAASLIGAVNCVTIRDGRLFGENTDGKGFLASLGEVCDPAGKRCAIVGAGGAARAIAFELALAGAGAIAIVSRNAAQANALAEAVTSGTGVTAVGQPLLPSFAIAEDVDVFINATSVGMHPDTSMLDLAVDSFRPGLVVADVVPNPPVSRMLATAAEHGATTLNGLGMLVNQGAAAVKLWTGIDADTAVMHAALDAIFSG